jgi:hypothetical protein
MTQWHTCSPPPHNNNLTHSNIIATPSVFMNVI